MTPPASGIPRLNAKTRRSRHARCSVSRIRRNWRNLTSIVESVATTASLTRSVVNSNWAVDGKPASGGTSR